jgi:hypothetical protein
MNKLICWIFGHIYREKVFDRMDIDILNRIQYFTWEWPDRCPRCGKKLK